MERGEHSLVTGPGRHRTVLHVRLTDSVLQALQARGHDGPTLEFAGSSGRLAFPSISGERQEGFRFALAKSESVGNNTIVSTVSGARQLESVGVVSKDVIRFEATKDAFNKVGEQFKNIQRDRGKQSTVLLENQFRTRKNSANSVDKVKKVDKVNKVDMVNKVDKVNKVNMVNKVDKVNKVNRVNMVNTTMFGDISRKRAAPVSEDEGVRCSKMQRKSSLKAEINLKPISSLRTNSTNGIISKVGYQVNTSAVKDSIMVPDYLALPTVETSKDGSLLNKEVTPAKQRISPDTATSTAHDQGYVTDSDDSNTDIHTAEKDAEYKLMYKEVKADFLVKYKPINSNSQRKLYKQHFELEYPKYLAMHRILSERYSQFCQNERKKKKVEKTKIVTQQDMTYQTNVVNKLGLSCAKL